MKITEEKITLRQPDDWHLHLRDGVILDSVVTPTAKVFRRAVIMPNLTPTLTTLKAVIDYRKRIEKAIPAGLVFTPLMTLYLTDDLSPEIMRKGYSEGIVFAVNF